MVRDDDPDGTFFFLWETEHIDSYEEPHRVHGCDCHALHQNLLYAVDRLLDPRMWSEVKLSGAATSRSGCK